MFKLASVTLKKRTQFMEFQFPRKPGDFLKLSFGNWIFKQQSLRLIYKLEAFKVGRLIV